MDITRNLCFIPAKAASTRLKKKNLLKLQGKELLFYPIENARKSGYFLDENIILSTESIEIKECAEKHGAHVPYLREEKLARDPYGVIEVTLDFFEKFPKFASFDKLCILLPTSPLMIPDDISEAFRIYESSDFKSVMSVSPTDHNALRSVFVRDQHIVPVFPEAIPRQSTELESTYRINGAVIVVDIHAFIKEKTYFLNPWGAYLMPAERAIDIDTEFDYQLARFYMSMHKSF